MKLRTARLHYFKFVRMVSQAKNLGRFVRVDHTAGHDEETFSFVFWPQSESGKNNQTRDVQQRACPTRSRYRPVQGT